MNEGREDTRLDAAVRCVEFKILVDLAHANRAGAAQDGEGHTDASRFDEPGLVIDLNWRVGTLLGRNVDRKTDRRHLARAGAGNKIEPHVEEAH